MLTPCTCGSRQQAFEYFYVGSPLIRDLRIRLVCLSCGRTTKGHAATDKGIEKVVEEWDKENS